MLGKLLRWGAFLLLIGAAVFFWITRPAHLPNDALAGLTPDLEAGQQVFTASGCASCHMAPKAEGEAKLLLAGGQRFASPFGTFIAPNISQNADHGIGGWSQLDFVNAVLKGVSPEGAHYFPAFPYTSYTHMTPQDAVSLYAYMQTLPSDPTPSLAHEVGFPFNIRRSVGGWKWLYLSEDFVQPASDAQLERGRYLVEALGHCAECHTTRDALGGLDRTAWLQGADNPSGPGRIPGITPAQLGWVEADIVEYLTSGFTPEFDTAGGHMVAVVENTAQLPEEDRRAIAAYLLALP